MVTFIIPVLIRVNERRSRLNILQATVVLAAIFFAGLVMPPGGIQDRWFAAVRAVDAAMIPVRVRLSEIGQADSIYPVPTPIKDAWMKFAYWVGDDVMGPIKRALSGS
jgi:hypothetical protein